MLSPDVHKLRQSRARADVNRVVAFFFQQFIDGHGPAHNHVRLKLHAHLAHVVDLLPHNLFGKAELRNPVDQHATNFVQRFKHPHLVAFLDQIPCNRQSRGSTADNGDFFPRGRRVRHYVRSHTLFVISNEALQITDAERLYLFRKKALPLALILLRADASRDRGQHVRFADLRRRAEEISNHNFLDERLHIDAYGTIIGARRLRAFQAAQRLLLRQFRAIAKIHFFKIVRTLLRWLLRHQLTGNLNALFRQQWIVRFRGRAHRFSPSEEEVVEEEDVATQACSDSRLCLYSSMDCCSAVRYIALRCTSTSKFTLCPSNSGPSTQANSLLPSIMTRHPPHIPVPSIMIGFRLTTVWMFSFRVNAETAFIITIGPTATTKSMRVPFSINCRSLSVTKPLSA